jgi:hypothetical protein
MESDAVIQSFNDSVRKQPLNHQQILHTSQLIKSSQNCKSLHLTFSVHPPSQNIPIKTFPSNLITLSMSQAECQTNFLDYSIDLAI